jgi:hypothetical protein
MRGKLLLVVGLAAGYVLGAKAGRGRYEDIKRATSKLWGDPRVQRQVKNVEGRAKEFAKDKAPEVVDFLSDGAKKVVSQVNKSKSPAARTAESAKPASASGE